MTTTQSLARVGEPISAPSMGPWPRAASRIRVMSSSGRAVPVGLLGLARMMTAGRSSLIAATAASVSRVKSWRRARVA